MSVYKDKRSPFYTFEFQLRGVRFKGTTGCATRRTAEAFEREEREKAGDYLKRSIALENAPLTFVQAAARYWIEVGQFLRGDGSKNCKWSIAWLEREVGAHRLVGSIDDALVARLVAIRRGQGVKPATVNRSMTEQLKKILNRSRETWNQTTKKIDWKRHMLAEPKERTRELSEGEEGKLFGALRADYHDVVRFAIMAGCRMCEIVPGKAFTGLRWSDVDWGGRRITITGKGGVVAKIPLSAGLRALLFPLQGQHDVFVFTYIAQRRAPGYQRGDRRPVTREGLKSEWRRTKLDAALIDYRFHDNRHTAATRLLRSSGNIKIVQRLLRHQDIATTSKYAHVLDDDIRLAMERVEESPTKSPIEDDRPSKTAEK